MKQIEELRELVKSEEKREPPTLDTKSIVDNQFQMNLKQISENEQFLKVSKEITERAVHAKLEEEAIDVLNKEQKNELAKHVLKLEKDKLNYRQKHEKKVILRNIKADLQNQKIVALKKRYGYMYKENEPFIPSKLHNIQKEIVNKWESTSINTKKIIKGVIRTLFYGTLAILIGIIGWNIIEWVLSNADKLQSLK